MTAARWHEVSSPYDGRRVGRVRWHDVAAAEAAVERAAAAMARGGFPAYERAAVLRRAADVLADRAETVATLLSAEVGKPIAFAQLEVARTVDTLMLSAVEATRIGGGEIVPMDATAAGAGHLAWVRRRPVGVIGAITPFNFPLNLAAHKIGPAIAAGCACVLKPADKAPLAAHALGDVLSNAGLPPGWLTILVADPAGVAEVFARREEVGLITFTGSSAIGWALRAKAPRKRVSLELGNATPMIVDDTVDVDTVVGPIARSAFGSAGQSCISVQRVYVQRALGDAFVEALAGAAHALPVGDPADPATVVGPLITPDAANRALAAVDASVAAGAHLICGGEIDGALLTPTVLREPPDDSSVIVDELFAPVVSVCVYDDLDEAIARCNATRYGLQASIHTSRLADAIAASERLEFAGVLVNQVPTYRADQMPYGGIKESGNAREGPAYAIKEMTEERLTVVGGWG